MSPACPTCGLATPPEAHEAACAARYSGGIDDLRAAIAIVQHAADPLERALALNVLVTELRIARSLVARFAPPRPQPVSDRPARLFVVAAPATEPE